MSEAGWYCPHCSYYSKDSSPHECQALSVPLKLIQKYRDLEVESRLAQKMIRHFYDIEIEAEKTRDLRVFKRCAFCKCKIIPSLDRDGLANYYKKKCYHLECAENFTDMFV
jgi:hypothetical protein